MKDFFSQIKTRWLIGVYIACIFLSILFVEIFFSYSEFDEGIDSVFFTLNTLILSWFWWKRRKLKFQSEKIISKSIPWKEVIFLLFFNLVFSFGISLFFSYLVANFFPAVISWMLQEPPILLKKDFGTLLVSFLGAVLAGPIAEEFVFRGVMLNRFMKRWRVAVAIFVSSALFGLVHGDPFMAVGAFVFGITLSVVYLKTHIAVPIVIHILNNLLVFIFGVVDLYFNPNYEPGTSEQMIAQMERYGLTIGLPLVLFSGFFLFRYTRKNWPRNEKHI